MHALGIYLLGSLVFVVSALLEFAFVVLLSRATSHVKKYNENDTKNKEVCPNSGRLRKRKISDQDNSYLDRKVSDQKDSEINGLEATEERVQDNKIAKVISNMTPIYVVEFAMFCLYVFLFILFNVIYWIRYQM